MKNNDLKYKFVRSINEFVTGSLQILAQILKFFFLMIFTVIKNFGLIVDSTIGAALRYLQKKFKFSLSFKLNSIYISSFILIMLIISGIIIGSFRYFLIQEEYKKINTLSSSVEKILIRSNALVKKTLNQTAEEENIVISIFDEEEYLLYSSDKKESLQTFMRPEYELRYKSQNSDVVVLNRLIRFDNKNYYLQISKSLLELENYMGVLFAIMFGSTIIGIILTAFVGLRFSSRMLKPIKDMTETAKTISAKNISYRFDVSESQDELKDLATQFNSTLDNLQNSYEKQDRFVSDASHELRTPISVIQGYANLLSRWGKNDPEVLDESIEAIKQETESMKDLVEKLLFLARSDKNTQKVEMSKHLIFDLIDEIGKETLLVDNNKHKFEYSCECNSEIFMDRKLIKQAIRILLDNSLKYTPNNKCVSLRCEVKNKNLYISISDNGPGIPKNSLNKIFDRFYRVDESRTKSSGGTGLGLSIAKWIVDVHTGDILVTSEVGVGTRMTIKLPLPPTKNQLK